MKKLVLILCFIVQMIFSTKAQDKKILSDGFIFKFNSEVLNENKDIYISLPEDFKNDSNNNNYPIIFLTEAEFVFKPFSSIIRTMGQFNEIPKSIVVGLPLDDKHIDYAPILKDVPESGHADKMLKFISQELFIYLDSVYGIDYDRTVLWTHSGIGGLFGINTFLSADTTFNGFIISSPNFKFAAEYLNVNEPFEYLKQRKNVSMYLTCGSKEYSKFQPSFENISKRLNGETIPRLRWKIQVNYERDHHTSAYAGLIDGLIFYFNEEK